MMSRKWAIVALCALLAALVVGFTVLRPSEEDRIRKTLDRFTKAIAVKPDDNPLSRMGRLKSELKETTSDDIYVVVPDYDVRMIDRASLVENATKIPAVYQTAECELSGMTIKIDEAATTAKVDATAIVTGMRGGERKTDKRGVHFLLRKDGDWKITSIDVAPRAE